MTSNSHLAVPRRLTLEEWATFDVDARVELVEGVPVVNPPESFVNLRIATRLGRMIEDGTASTHAATPQAGVALSREEQRPTVRIPDLVVTTVETAFDGLALPVDQVVLVVEVSSTASLERDLVTKRADYARAGIPRYLIVDRFARRLVSFDEIVDGRYADPVVASSVTLRLGGWRVELAITDLLP